MRSRWVYDGEAVGPREGHIVLNEYFDSTLAAARGGAAWAWESIYRDLAGAVGGYLRGRGAPDVEDLVSETFLSVAKDIHTSRAARAIFVPGFLPSRTVACRTRGGLRAARCR